MLLSLFIGVAVCFASTVQAYRLPDAKQLTVEMLKGKVAYVQIGQFTANLIHRIRPTFQNISGLKPRGVIVDFRDSQGGDAGVVQEILESLLPNGTPYMRLVMPTHRSIATTAHPPVLKKSTPLVVLRGERTVNEPDIAIYALQKLRGAGVLELTPDRGAIKRYFKQNARMSQYMPINAPTFFVAPDIRLIVNEGADQEDVIARAISFIRESSPWDEERRPHSVSTWMP